MKNIFLTRVQELSDALKEFSRGEFTEHEKAMARLTLLSYDTNRKCLVSVYDTLIEDGFAGLRDQLSDRRTRKAVL